MELGKNNIPRALDALNEGPVSPSASVMRAGLLLEFWLAVKCDGQSGIA